MTERQKRFCEEYLIDLNATRAYMAAYPSVKKESSAASCAAKLLRIAKVSNFIQERLKDRQECVHVTQEDVLRGIMRIAFDVHGCKASVRLRALELLGKHLGMFDKDDLDREEQRARIAKFQKEAERTDEMREISVNIMGMSVDELAEVIA